MTPFAPVSTAAAPRHVWLKAAVFALLGVNVAIYVSSGTLSEALDAASWLALLVLFELEQMTKNEVAELLGIPPGTAASRLRKAREEFKACVRRRLARAALAKRPA